MNNEITVQNFFDDRPESYGSAGLTALEFKAYRSLIKRLGCSTDRAREWMDTGKELPLHSRNVRNDFLESALMHGCSVAGNIEGDILMGNAGRTYEDTTWSYNTKDRAYRFIDMKLIQNERIELLSEWRGNFEKQPYEIGKLDQSLTRPAALQKDKNRNAIIPGIEKTACYFPTQLLRVLEGLRLGKESIVEIIDQDGNKKLDILSEEAEQFMIQEGKVISVKKVDGINPESFTFYWESLDDAINTSNTIQDIAVNVALAVSDYLMTTQQLRESTVALIISKGYSPSGPINEHGLKQEVTSIWDRILTETYSVYPTLWENLRYRYIKALNGNTKK